MVQQFNEPRTEEPKNQKSEAGSAFIGNSRRAGELRLGKEFADGGPLGEDHGAADGGFDFLSKVDV